VNTKQTNSKIKLPFFIKMIFKLLLLFFSGITLFPIQLAKSDVVNLKCTGKFEINRGELIKPDWEISYFKVNLDGLKSTVEDQGIKKEGKTLIRKNNYTILYRDNKKIKTKYKINSTYGTYIVEYPKSNRTLIGTCQKGRG
tara:strand:- start:98 stop:520 length:423 start_codon:yes stop_codon:yes gene_type:complete